MKKYKIVNRYKFITFVTLVLLVISFATVGIFGLIKADGSEVKEYAEVQIVPGDTIWQLAKTYGDSSKDIRVLVHDICSINNIKAESLHAGQVILIPIN